MSEAAERRAAPAGSPRPPQPRALRGLRRLLRAFAALALGVLLALVVAEAALRYTAGERFTSFAGRYAMYEQAGPGRVRPIPGWRGSVHVAGRDVEVQLDQFGMRGPEPGPKAAAERRVLVLGDSMAFGHGVVAADAFPALLQRQLGASTPVTVGNAGVPGNNHCEQCFDLERLGPAFEPDLVVSCVFTGNDFDGEFFGPKEAVGGYYFDAATAGWLRSSWRARLALSLRTAFVVEDFLSRHVPSLQMDRSTLVAPPEVVALRALGPPAAMEGIYMDALAETPPIGETLARLERNVAALVAGAGGAARLLVVVLPTDFEVSPRLYEAALQHFRAAPAEGYRRGLGAERVAALCARHGVQCVDLTPVLAAEPVPNALFLPEDRHLSERGHEVVAQALAPVIAEMLGGR